jgi:hypothetical protein
VDAVTLRHPSPLSLPLMVERFREKLTTEQLTARLDRILRDMEHTGQAGRARAHFAPLHGAAVQHQQAAGGRCAGTGQQLEGFGGLHGADDADQGRKHAQGGALRFLHIASPGGNTQA